MKPVLIVYATPKGHTHRLCGHMSESLNARDFPTELVDTKGTATSVDLDKYSGVIVTASVQLGKHEPELVSFVKAHRQSLADMPAAFLSVSLPAPGAELYITTAADRAGARVRVQVDRFFTETEWHPAQARPVAGALMYSNYGWLVSWVMRRTADITKGNSGDHKYTDWEKLDDFVEHFVARELLPTLKFKTL